VHGGLQIKLASTNARQRAPLTVISTQRAPSPLENLRLLTCSPFCLFLSFHPFCSEFVESVSAADRSTVRTCPLAPFCLFVFRFFYVCGVKIG
jgi:hypothetical protein